MPLPYTAGSHAFSPIARWRGEFISPITEAAFLRQEGPRIAHDLSRSLRFCAIFYLAFALTDFATLGYGDHALLLFVARLAVAAVAVGGAMVTRSSLGSARTAYRAATFVTSLGMATFLLVVQFRSADMMLHGMSMAIMLVIVYLFIPNRLTTAILVASVASTAFLALAFALGTLDEGRMLTMSMLLLLANLFGAAAALRNAHLVRQQYGTQQILTNLSVRDALTGTFNRRHLNAGLLDSDIARARRDGSPLTLIMCDLDNFKAINDTHGHQAGDVLLQDFSSMLLSMTRDGTDTVVRYGGEEFLLILPGTGREGGMALAERMRTRFAGARSTHDNAQIATTASFGVVTASLAPEMPAMASHALIAQADALLYAAKRGGRNRVCGAAWPTTQAA